MKTKERNVASDLQHFLDRASLLQLTWMYLIHSVFDLGLLCYSCFKLLLAVLLLAKVFSQGDLIMKSTSEKSASSAGIF